MNSTIHPARIYQLILLGVILFLALKIWSELSFMFPSLLGAVALYVLLKGPLHWLVNERKLKDWIATLVLLVITAAIIVVPLWFIVKLLIENAQPLVNNPAFMSESFDQIDDYLNEELGLSIMTEERIMKITGFLAKLAQDLLSGTFKTAAVVVFMFLFLYFMLANSRKMELYVRKYLPFRNSNKQKLFDEVERMVKSNSITIPTVAFLQGFVALIGYIIFGIPDAMLFGVLTAISSVVPVVGAMLIYLPLAIYTMATGDVWSGVGVALWGFLLVGTVDNIARFILQKRLANVHPLVTILGVIMGTKLFGLIGIIFGPLMITLFVALLRIYFNEFGDIRNHAENIQDE